MIPTGNAVTHQGTPEALALAFGHHPDVAEVEQRFVRLGPGRGDQIAVIDGIGPGDEVVTSGVFKLRTGAAVFVNNRIQPGNNPAPKPEDS